MQLALALSMAHSVYPEQMGKKIKDELRRLNKMLVKVQHPNYWVLVPCHSISDVRRPGLWLLQTTPNLC